MPGSRLDTLQKAGLAAEGCPVPVAEGGGGKWMGGATRFLDGLGLAGRRQLAEGGRLRSQVQGGVSARITGPERE